ncbi:MAG TPA: DUF4157 domain-containing protein, partial [Roseiflexaceae bacterium]|nr:DUF4157 domain-containing protein [Roseiflexaceae bacterium]
MHETRRTRRKPAEQDTLPTWSETAPAAVPATSAALVQREAAEAAVEPEAQELTPPGHSFGSMSLFAEAFDAGAPAAPAAPSGPLDPPDFPIQASLRINAPGDVFEQEADQMASAVMGMSSEGDAAPAGPGLQVQRAASSHDGGLETSPAVDASIAQMQGGGQPLPSGERSFFENRFGHDFSQIRIHADTHAAQTAQSLNARAFTVGNDIAFDAGEYQPGTSSGRHLLTHEMTHTIQQTGGVATKRVQRKEDQPEQAEEAPEEEAPEQSPADLVALAQQTLTEDEVSAQAVAPVEAQPVELPETQIEDQGGGGGAGGGGVADAAPAEAAKAAAEQKLAEAEKTAQATQTAPGGAAAANQPAPQPAPAGNSPAAGVAAGATQAAPEAAPVEQKAEQKPEAAPATETKPAAAGGEANAPGAQP